MFSDLVYNNNEVNLRLIKEKNINEVEKELDLVKYELFELKKYKDKIESWNSQRANIKLDIKSDDINWDFYRKLVLF